MRRFRIVFTLLVVIGLFGSASALAAPGRNNSPSPPGQVDRGVVDDITREVRGETDSFCWDPFAGTKFLYYKMTEECPPNRPLELVLPADEPVDLCINLYSRSIRYAPGQECVVLEITHTVPDDGPLGICVNAFNPKVRQSPSEANCEDPFRWWIFYEVVG